LGLGLAVAVAAAMLAAAATPASADIIYQGTCPGSKIDHKDIWWNGRLAGEVKLYYNSSDGRNCAQTFDYLSGKAKMGATLWVYNLDRNGMLVLRGEPEDTVNAWFYEYSDGARLWAAGHCVKFGGDYGRYTNDGDYKAVHPESGVGHCG
jgi:hypothetical protein